MHNRRFTDDDTADAQEEYYDETKNPSKKASNVILGWLAIAVVVLFCAWGVLGIVEVIRKAIS